jgi:arginine exporter protein ArgO
MLSKSFGKDEGFTIGLIVLSFIFYPILAFGSAKYLGPYGDPVAFRALQEERLFDFEKKS